MPEVRRRAFGGGRGWIKPLVHLSDNLISKIGIVLVTTAAVAWLFVLPVEAREGGSHPYLGLLFFVALPAMFFLGLLIIPIGVRRKLMAERKAGKVPERLPPLDWSNVEVRHLVKLIGIATVVNIILGGYMMQATVSYMDSANFCGSACHTMTPEFTAYRESPHVNVPCVECHVGAGATAYVESKMRGAGQLAAIVLDNYDTPIPTPVRTLRPAREICEKCHWPQNFGGYRIDVVDKFDVDEQNTPSKTVLMMRIGGGPVTRGIHGFHMKPGIVIEYAATPDRQEIPWIRYTTPDGVSTEYAVEEWDGSKADEYEFRTMDCLDCHTRPSHRFYLPDRALNRALMLGDIDPYLPWVKKTGLEIIQREYASTAEAEEKIPAALVEYYRNELPGIYAENQAEIERSAQGLLAVYRRNVFPEMKVTWGTYPDQIGHEDFPGCFRCHDEMHESPEGKAIPQDCSTCHELLAMEESDPEVLGNLGIQQ